MSRAQILDGRELAEEIKHKLRWQVVNEKLRPALAIVLVGNDPASHLYVKLKEKACRQVGIGFNKYLMPAKAELKEVLDCINWLNKDPDIDGILVQLPLPEHLDENKIIASINPKKDADGFHPENLINEKAVALPAPANAVFKLIQAAETFRSDCQALVIANNEIFFKPISKLLDQYNIKTEYTNAESPELNKKINRADILIVAVGKPNFINGDSLKEDAIIIDVGTNRVNGKTIGDVDNKKVMETASAISPVPGGVGPMTIACLLENVIALHKQNKFPPDKEE